uniref:Uncharacterized protein MANES_17G115300 n=1 Tax=Rhizophora mucronata TaxID=61149 RepID=A0A2P2K2A9_RHIMU
MSVLASARSNSSGRLRCAFKRDNIFWYHCCLVNDESSLSSLSRASSSARLLNCTNITNPRSYGCLRTFLEVQPWLRLPCFVRAQQNFGINSFVSERKMSSASVVLKTDCDVVRFSIDKPLDRNAPLAKGEKKSKRVRMSKRAKRNELRFYRLMAKKKMNSPNPEVRIRYKLQKAKRKEAWLIEKLRKFDVPKASVNVYDPEILTEEEKHYLKRTGEKKKMYVPVGRRGVFGGVVLNMHLHWKKHETIKVVCKPCKPGQIHDYAEELAQLSRGIVIDIKPNNTIIFYRGKNYVQPEVMSPPETLSKAKVCLTISSLIYII